MGSYRVNVDSSAKKITGDLDSIELVKFDSSIEELLTQENASKLLEERLQKLLENKTILQDELRNHIRWKEEITLRGKVQTKEQKDSE